MGSRAYSTAIIALVLVVGGIWWALPRNDSVDGRDATSEVLHLSAAPAQVETSLNTDHSDETVGNAGSSPVPSSDNPEDISARADPESALSTELEYIIQRTVDATFDRGRYAMQSISCSGSSCAVRFVALQSPQGQEEMMVMRRLYHDLSTASFVHPGTGVRFKLKSLELRQGTVDNAANTFLMNFDSQ